MKKGFTLVELIVMVALVVLVVFMFKEFVWKELIKPSPSPAIYRIERPLKQFAVNQGGFSGSFFLGSGSISGGGRNYYFYYKTKEGNKFRPASVPLGMASIVEDGQNKVVFLTKPLADLSKNELSSLENYIDQGWFAYSERTRLQEFEFHIPPGSILEEYNPNLSSPN